MSDNLLLAVLPPAERERLAPFFTTVELKQGDRMIEPGQPIRYLWFPIDAITSTIQVLSDGTMIESGLMGLEGVVGLQIWLRQKTTDQLTFAQVPGRAKRIDSAVFRREVMDHGSPLNDLMGAYIHAFLVLTGQTAACNRLHPVDQRLCRWLRMVYNRVPQKRTFPMRQEYLADMLGVHRPSVSVAAAVIQKAGWISYSRGEMQILDPDGLSSGACECLEIMERQFDRMFQQPWLPLARQEMSAERQLADGRRR